MSDGNRPVIADAAELRTRYRVAAVIGGILFLGVLIHAIVVEFLSMSGMPEEAATLTSQQAEMLRLALLGGAAITFFVIRAFNRILVRSGDRGPAPVPVQRLFIAAVVTCVMCEVPSVLGIVLFVLGRARSDYYLFFLISCFFFSVHFPRYRQWEEAVRQPMR